jgi:hypothetical protein
MAHSNDIDRLILELHSTIEPAPPRDHRAAALVAPVANAASADAP